jgi:hypothetical protein
MSTLRTPSIVVITLLGALVAGAADRELQSTKRYPAAAAKRVIVDVANLAVEARAADLPVVEAVTDLRIGGVTEAQGDNWIARNTPVVEDSEGQISFRVPAGRRPFMWIGALTARARLRLRLPTEVVPDITTTSGDISLRGDFPNARPLHLRTATGQVELDGAAASIDVRSAAGDARITVFRPLDSLFVRTSSGQVVLDGGAREATIDTASGAIRLSNLSGSTTVTTSTGRVELSWDRLDPGASVRVRSASGRVRLVIPEHSDPGGTLKTTDGTIRCDLPGRINDAGDTVSLEGDGATLDIETASGDILLGRSDGWQVHPGNS